MQLKRQDRIEAQTDSATSLLVLETNSQKGFLEVEHGSQLSAKKP